MEGETTGVASVFVCMRRGDTLHICKELCATLVNWIMTSKWFGSGISEDHRCRN